MTTKAVSILRDGNTIGLDPTDGDVKAVVAPLLTYEFKRFFRGKDLFQRKKLGLARIEIEPRYCFDYDGLGRLVTNFGFLEPIRDALVAAGYVVTIEDLVTPPRPEAYVPDWDRVLEDKTVTLRHRQEEFLRLLTRYECGRIDCPTGFGKSYLLAMACKLFPQARIDVLARPVAVLRDRIYPELCGILPAVGIVGGALKHQGRRVMCYTFGSMDYADGDADFVFVDECHQAGADDFAYKAGKYRHGRMWGFSASHEMRLDGQDIRCLGMFGPVRMKVTYQEAQAHRMVAPMAIFWTDVVTNRNPCTGLEDTDKLRAGVWAHAYRNRLIAADARRYGPDTQVLITVATLEHALHLKRLLPEFSLVYSGNGVSSRDLRAWAQAGLVDDGFTCLTDREKVKRTKQFEAGTLKKVIVTTVWNVGVNLLHLDVLVRADAGGSPINDTQIPGRNARTAHGKQVGIVHDYCDQFDTGFRRKAKSRADTYALHGWTQHEPGPGQAAALLALMET